MTLPSFATARFSSEPGWVVQVPCVELSFFVPDTTAQLEEVVAQIYAVHPYEEPVILITPCVRSLHIPGQDENNPNRFWNSDPEDWVPAQHRSYVQGENGGASGI